MSYLNSDSLIRSLKRRASIPESQVTFEEQDFLDILNEEMQIGLVPSILSVHEEYLVYSVDIPVVQNQATYPIPYRAIGNKVREVSRVDSGGNSYPMAKVNPEDAHNDPGVYGQVYLGRFLIEGGNIKLLDSTLLNGDGFLRIKYYLRPNQLVSSKRAAQITSINTLTGVITFSSNLPKNFSNGMLIDFNRTKSDHRIIKFDVAVTATTLNSITVDPADLPASLEIGDYVCAAGETYIPNIPTDLHVVLAHRGAARCVEAMGDANGLAAANQKLAEMELKTQQLIDNRSDGNPKKVINRNNFFNRRGRWSR